VVQAYNREAAMLAHFETQAEDYKNKQVKMAKIDAIYFPVMSLLIGVSIIIVVCIGGIHVGNKQINPGTLAAFLEYVNKLMWPVSSLGWTASLIQRAAASQKRINTFLREQPSVQVGIGEPTQLKGEIKFDDVSFTYPDTGIQALKNVSFSIKAGQSLAIIGRTGSGKTTIADLLLRMYDATSGSILLDGKNIKQLEAGSLRQQIGFVPQDVFLFSETTADNITFGLPESNLAKAKEFANYASIGREIEAFPEGYETMVGERGVTLSGGQKQRISIARALIKQPNVLLLDDSLSAVDTATEKAIQQNLDKVLKGKSAIVITHRILAMIQFDHIIVLDEGRIVEQGTHEELLNKKGLYLSIYERQMNEQQVETEEA
jgi:ATP-binding cassette subfamily B protein